MKKHYIKKLFATVAVLLCSITANAHDFEVDGIYYNLISSEDLTVKVTYKGDKYNSFSNEYTGDVIIPSTVTYKSKVLKVTSIGEKAFRGCSGLTSVVIGNSVTSIDLGAFSDCSGLTSIVIGNSVTSIGNYAFSDCSGLTSITIPNSVTSIGDRAFSDCSGLTSITIPNSVTRIGDYAFYDCSRLKTVINLSSLTITKGSDENGYVGFYADKVINVPNGTIEGDFVFGKVYGNNTLCGYIGNDIELSLPDNYKGENYVIENYAFYDCSSLTSIEIPNSVTSIGYKAFYGCSDLTSVVIGNSVTSIGNSAFYGCSDLTSVVIGNSVTSIGNSAFYDCSSLTSITIPNSVTSIDYYAFSGCDSLASIRLLGETPPTVDSNDFTNKQYMNMIVYVPKGTLATYQAADTWKNFWDIQEFDATAIENIEEVTPAFEITSSGIQFTAADSKTVAIYTVAGALIEKVNSYAGETIALDKGVYIIQIGEETTKVKL